MMNSGEVSIVCELGKHDVLLGRGTGPNEHAGNVRFRKLASDILQAHVDDARNVATTAAGESNQASKNELAKKVVSSITREGGKFVRKLRKDEVAMLQKSSPSTHSKGKEFFIVVPENVAIDKAKQSFRHQLRVLEQNDTMSAGKTKRSGRIDPIKIARKRHYSETVTRQQKRNRELLTSDDTGNKPACNTTSKPPSFVSSLPQTSMIRRSDLGQILGVTDPDMSFRAVSRPLPPIHRPLSSHQTAQPRNGLLIDPAKELLEARMLNFQRLAIIPASRLISMPAPARSSSNISDAEVVRILLNSKLQQHPYL